MEILVNDGYVNTLTDEAGVTTISFFHPLQNSLPAALLAQLAQAIHDAGASPHTKVIILKSDGNKSFCAGANFNELLQITDEEQGRSFFAGFANVINACRTSSKLIIGRVHGKAVGGGVGIAAAADYCFATQNVSIKLSELNIGIGPFVIEPAVTRRIGLTAFTQLTLNPSDFFDADWAKQKGLFAEVYETAAEMDSAILTLATQITTWNPEAILALKKVLWEGTHNWETLLNGRASLSGQLVLSTFAQSAIGMLRSNK